MRIIAVLNQKGGAGKTTIATHLARAFQQQGQSVILVDSDPQGSARDWYAARDEPPVPVYGIDRPVIEKSLRPFADHDLVIIDGAPQIEALAVSAIKAADLVLIPVQPSPYDVWATSDLVDLVKARMEITDGRLRAAFVVSRAIRGTRIGAEIIGALQEYHLPILSGRIHQRVAYPESAKSGLTVLDSEPKGEAAAEVRVLAAELTGVIL